uniref:Uncharacterized protein n=1 Tax=Arundo donax TaxID=35708 RepID=A0A0A8Y4J9_ARUDO
MIFILDTGYYLIEFNSELWQDVLLQVLVVV